jgi:sulfate/thiosulfate-binding protein
MRTAQPSQPRFARLLIAVTLILLAILGGCFPNHRTSTKDGGIEITVYGFSIMKEVLEKKIFPGFARKWQTEHQEHVHFTSSFAGSETVTNQIMQGVKAEVAFLSTERDVQRLQQGGFVTSNWQTSPYKGTVNKTPFVILVRQGNPKNIHDFGDLARSGVGVIHPDPVSSGGAQWSILAVYGSELVKSQKQSGEPDKARAFQTLQAVWRNVISTPGSAREARTQFETGFGDALITYELDGLLMKTAGAPVEIIVPPATIFSEHPVVLIDKNVSAEKRSIVDAFVQYLWSDEAQQAFVKFHFYSVTNNSFNEASSEFGRIELPFTIDYFGGWEKAYPEVIEKVFKEQVQPRK